MVMVRLAPILSIVSTCFAASSFLTESRDWVICVGISQRRDLPVLPRKRKYQASTGTSAPGQSTKSLRDSPLRGGLPARAVTKGEIVDSGRRALS